MAEARPTRRVFLALDATSHDVDSLEAAMDLTAGLQTELLGLFVEDTNLLDLARLPFAREVVDSSGRSLGLDRPRMERLMRIRAEEARRAVEKLARLYDVKWSFRVARGRYPAEAMSGSAREDLLVLGGGGTTPREPCTPRLRPVLAVIDETEEGRRTLEAAIEIARLRSAAVVVLLPAATEARHSLQASVEELAGIAGVHAEAYLVDELEVQRLVDVARKSRSRIVLLPRDHALVGEDVRERLCSRAPCPIVLVH